MATQEIQTAQSLQPISMATEKSRELLFEAPVTPPPGTLTHDVSSKEEWDIHGLERAPISSPPPEPNGFGQTNGTSSPQLVLKSFPSTPTVEATPQKSNHTNGIAHDSYDDEDPSQMVITSLRTQLNDMYAQLEALNSKLVKSYGRISALEDTLDHSQAELRQANTRTSKLEKQQESHVSALNSGVLVERAAVASELSRLMEKATEEERRRVEEEKKRADIEKELDELSAGLFGQANEMVKEERIARDSAERRVVECESLLQRRGTEIATLETGLKVSQDSCSTLEREVLELKSVVKEFDRRRRRGDGMPRLINIHSPYKEFVGFVNHLRNLATSTPSPPAIPSLLALPFLARLVSEDSEPTLRLDAAPSLNWLTRRSVLTAIHTAQMTIDSIHIAQLFLESSIAGSSGELQVTQMKKVVCALCGKVIWALDEEQLTPAQGASGTWGNANKFFKNVVTTSGTPPSNAGSFGRQVKHMPRPASPVVPTSLQTVIQAFRMATTISGASHPGGLPTTPNVNGGPSNAKSTPYPLCNSGWCISRLQTTLALWRFVREGVIDRIWEEETRGSIRSGYSGISNVGPLAGPPSTSQSTPAPELPPTVPPKVNVPSTPPTKRKLSSLWGAFGGNSSPDSTNSTPTSTSTLGGFGLAGILGRKNSTPSVASSATTGPPPALPPRNVRRISSVGPTDSSPSVPENDLKAIVAFDEKPNANPVPLDRAVSSVESLGSPANFATPSQGLSPDLAKTLEHESMSSILPEAKPKEESPSKDSAPATEEKAADVQPVAIQEDTTKHSEPNPEPTSSDKLNGDAPVEVPKTTEQPISTNTTEVSTEAPVETQTVIQSTPSTPARLPAAARPITPSGTGTPPPVPRRAAARGVRNSLLGGNATPKKEESPARPTAVAGVAEGAEVAEPVKSEAAPAEEVKKGQEQVPSEDSKTSPEALQIPESKEEKVSAVSDTNQQATRDPEGSAVAEEKVEEEEPLTPKSKIIPLHPVEDDNPPPLPTRGRQPSIVSASSASVYTRDNVPPHVVPDSPLAERNEEEDPLETEEEQERYVGNGTWEERAWIEIARIREEMFWARIGGVR